MEQDQVRRAEQRLHDDTTRYDGELDLDKERQHLPEAARAFAFKESLLADARYTDAAETMERLIRDMPTVEHISGQLVDTDVLLDRARATKDYFIVKSILTNASSIYRLDMAAAEPEPTKRIPMRERFEAAKEAATKKNAERAMSSAEVNLDQSTPHGRPEVNAEEVVV